MYIVYVVVIIIEGEYKLRLVYIWFYVIIFLQLPAMDDRPCVTLERTCF